MRSTRPLLGSFAAALALAAAAPAAPAAAKGRDTCSGGPISGVFHNLKITGTCTVPAGSTLDVRGNLDVAPGATFNAVTMSTVTIEGNVKVGKGATFGLGCTPASPSPPCDPQTPTNDVVGGNINADRPLTMYLDGDTIHGNVNSHGGGPGPTFSPYINFPIKDDVIDGNVKVDGWQGAWFGLIRDVVHGNVTISRMVGVAIGGLGTPDSTEVATNTIGGNLDCRRNSPPAQLGDSGGLPNVVNGNKKGECATL